VSRCGNGSCIAKVASTASIIAEYRRGKYDCKKEAVLNNQFEEWMLVKLSTIWVHVNGARKTKRTMSSVYVDDPSTLPLKQNKSNIFTNCCNTYFIFPKWLYCREGRGHHQSPPIHHLWWGWSIIDPRQS
jgi:hypothetical protein